MAWAPDYIDEQELATYLRIGDNTDDPEMRTAISGASRAIDHATNRQFGQVETAESRTFEVRWSRTRGAYIADIDDVQDLAGFTVTVSGTALASSSYQLLPRNAAQEGRPFERILVPSATPTTVGAGPPTIDATGMWGWTDVPETIRDATFKQASRFFKRRDAPFGVTGSPGLGGEMRLLAKVDADVDVEVKPFRRNWPMVL